MTHFSFNLLNNKVAVSDILTHSFLFSSLFPLWFVCLSPYCPNVFLFCFFPSFHTMDFPYNPACNPLYSKHLSHIFSTCLIIWLLRKYPSAMPSTQPCICCPLIGFSTTHHPLSSPSLGPCVL